MLAYKVSWGLGRKMKEKIKFPDAHVHGNFSPSGEAVELLFEGGRAVVSAGVLRARCTPQSVGRVPVVSPPALLTSPPPYGYDIGYSTIQAIALVVLTVHLVPYVVDRRGIKSIPDPGSPSSQMLGWTGLLVEVTSLISLVNCTDNTVRPFSHNSQNRLYSSGGFELTHVSSVCRLLHAHRSGPRINRQPCRLQSHLCAWNRTLERPLL